MAGEKFVKYKNGKFSTDPNGGGGGGSSTFSGLDDVEFTNLQDGQVPKYNSSTQKWENANESGGGGTVTDVKVNGSSVVDPQTGEANVSVPVTGVQVNGENVVDANKVAKINSYKELTQSEYNALPDSKLNDNILYAIEDVGGSEGFPPLIYSDEEREVGVWRDGKPLYQKCIVISALPSAVGDTAYQTGIQNVEKMWIVGGYCMYNNGEQMHPLNTFRRSNDDAIGCRVNNTNELIFSVGYNRSSMSAIVIVNYTKTTDTPGSGIWTTQGALAHHYSTDEHIIGTWIDGKPLYEKTIYIGSLTRGSSYTNVEHHISNIDKIISTVGMVHYTEGGEWANIPNPIGASSRLAVYSTTQYIRYYNDNVTYTDNAYFTLQYTKTTD